MLSSGMFISHLHVSEVVLMCKPSRKRGWEIVLPLCGRTSHGLTSWGRQRHTHPPPPAPVGSLSSQNVRVAFLLHFISTSWGREPVTSLNILMQRPSPPTWDKPPGVGDVGVKREEQGDQDPENINMKLSSRFASEPLYPALG